MPWKFGAIRYFGIRALINASGVNYNRWALPWLCLSDLIARGKISKASLSFLHPACDQNWSQEWGWASVLQFSASFPKTDLSILYNILNQTLLGIPPLPPLIYHWVLPPCVSACYMMRSWRLNLLVVCVCILKVVKWAIAFNKSTPLWMTDLFAYIPWDKNFCLDTPRTNSSLQRITKNLLKFTREYGDILVCQYPLGKTRKNHP